MNYTVKVCPEKILNEKVIQEKNIITTKLYPLKENVISFWLLQIPKQQKSNAITSDLNRAACMASVPGNEILDFQRKLDNAVYPLRFINSRIKQFSKKSSDMDDFIISPILIQIPKKVVLVKPYCHKMKLF